MKKNYSLLIAALGLGFAMQAQVPQRQAQVLKPLHAEATEAPTKTAAADSLEGETIAHLDAVILAIDNKVASVKNDQQQHEKALATGWYDKMTAARSRQVARKEALIARSNSK